MEFPVFFCFGVILHHREKKNIVDYYILIKINSVSISLSYKTSEQSKTEWNAQVSLQPSQDEKSSLYRTRSKHIFNAKTATNTKIQWAKELRKDRRNKGSPVEISSLRQSETRSSADADNRLDAFSGQSRSTNMVPFHMLHIVSYCAIVTLSLMFFHVFTIFVFKKFHDLEMGSKVTQGHWEWYHSIDCVWFPISVL